MIELYNADCLTKMQDIPDKSVDMICADLPQAITKNKWDVIIPFEDLWKQYERIAKENAAIVLFANQPFTALLTVSNPRLFRYNLVWQKTTPTQHLNAKIKPLPIHEDICVFYKKPPTYNPQKTTGHTRKVSTAHHKRNSKETTNYGKHGLTGYDSTERYPTSILKFPLDKQKLALHPTQKPVALLEWLIKTYTNPGQVVLDNVMGSGTCMVACKNTGRKGVGIERELEHYQNAVDRLNNKYGEIKLCQED